jgi:hypothetical protein
MSEQEANDFHEHICDLVQKVGMTEIDARDTDHQTRLELAFLAGRAMLVTATIFMGNSIGLECKQGLQMARNLLKEFEQHAIQRQKDLANGDIGKKFRSFLEESDE